MRICHITSAHNRYDGRIFEKQCRTLADNGNEVILICLDDKEDELRSNVYIKSYSGKKYSKKERFSLLYKNRNFVKYLLTLNAEVYQFHDIELLEVGRILHKHNKKVIFDSHENWFGYVSELFPKHLQWLVRRLMSFYYKCFVSRFDAIFTVSPNLVQQLSRYSDKVYMIPNYPSLDSICDCDITVKDNRFIYQGSVYAISNQINTTIAINRILNDTKYYIVGGIADSLKDEIIQFDSNNKVEFISWVDKHKLKELLQSSLAGMVLLDYCPICCNKEGQLGSNKIFEYMAAGLPVICTDFDLWKELIIDKYKCGIYVNPKNVEDIVYAMNYIIENPEEAYRMGRNGQEAIQKEFNWDCYKSYLLNIYKSIVDIQQ